MDLNKLIKLQKEGNYQKKTAYAKNKQRLDALTDKIVTINGETVRYIKPLDKGPYTLAKTTRKAKRYFKNLKKYNDSL